MDGGVGVDARLLSSDGSWSRSGDVKEKRLSRCFCAERDREKSWSEAVCVVLDAGA
jgi:hypothetical protein